MTTANNANQAQDKLYFRIALGLSIVVFIAVVVLNRKWLPRPEIIPEFVYFLPSLNALINGTCSLLLLLSLVAIKDKRIAAHRNLNLTAFLLSAVFLVSYVTYHFYADETTYPQNGLRTPYLIILTSHIILAALVLPLILLSFYHGLRMNIAKHKKLVRYAYPIWLYVTVTGVIVYLMISPYYQH
jgi:putative membrane protein